MNYRQHREQVCLSSVIRYRVWFVAILLSLLLWIYEVSLWNYFDWVKQEKKTFEEVKNELQENNNEESLSSEELDDSSFVLENVKKEIILHPTLSPTIFRKKYLPTPQIEFEITKKEQLLWQFHNCMVGRTGTRYGLQNAGFTRLKHVGVNN